MRPIDVDFCKELGATCIAARNKNGDLVAIASLDSIPTMYKCETCKPCDFYEKAESEDKDETN